MNRALSSIVALLLGSAVAPAQTTVPVDALAAYLHLDPADTASAAVAIPLAGLGLLPGSTVRIQPVGDWDNGPGGDGFVNMLAVFSASPTLLGPAAAHRVPDAVGAGIPAFTGGTWPGNEPTDIPEDFVMLSTAGVVVVIPSGATHLFATPADIYYRDNSDPDGDLGVQLTLVPTTGAPEGIGRPDRLTARPSPFARETTILFETSQAGAVRLTVHDVTGRLVRTLLDGGVPDGRHSVAWDGRSAAGVRAVPGTYFVRVDTAHGTQTRSVTLVH